MKAPTHSGGVVVRKVDGAWQCLLVAATGPDSEWVLPKGHIENGESPEEAALREVREEAGIVGPVLTALGIWQFDVGETTIAVEYFLIRAEETTAQSEDRAVRWLPFQEAIAATPFDEARGAILSALDELGTITG